MDPNARRADDELLEQVARRVEQRRFLATFAARMLFALAVAMFAILASLVVNPRSLVAACLVAAVALLAVATMLLDAHRAIVGQWPVLAGVAAFVQAVFYSLFLASALYVYVIPTRLLLSSVLLVNLVGLLFWRFRRRYLDAAEDAGRSEDA